MRVTRWQSAHRTLELDPPGGATRPAPQWLHHDVVLGGPVLPMPPVNKLSLLSGARGHREKTDTMF
jgi:hypothetical protein